MALRSAPFLAASAFAFVNLYAVRQSVVSLVLPRRIANIEIGEEVPGRYLLLATVALAPSSAPRSRFQATSGPRAARRGSGRPFGETDPYFGADLGFFVYWLPFETAIYYWAMLMLLVVIGVVIVLYALTPSLRWTRGALYVSAYVRRHFTMLGGMLLLALAWSYRLGMYRLLAEGSGAGGAFTSVDHRVTVPATLVLALVTLCAAVIVLWAGWSGQMRLAFFAVSAVLLLVARARARSRRSSRAVRSIPPMPRRERPISPRGSATRAAGTASERMRAGALGAGFRTTAELSGARRGLGRRHAAALLRARTARRRRRHRRAWAASPSGFGAMLVERGEDGPSDGREFWDIEPLRRADRR